MIIRYVANTMNRDAFKVGARRRGRTIFMQQVLYASFLGLVLHTASNAQTTQPVQPLQPANNTGALMLKQETTARPPRIRYIITQGNKAVRRSAIIRIPELRKVVGKPFTETNKEAITNAIDNYYHEHGYFVAKSFVTKQEGDKITVTIFEGVVDKIVVANKSNYQTADIKSYAAEALCGGKEPDCKGVPIERDKAERALGIVSDLPGIGGVQVALAPGSVVGSSALNIAATDAAAFTGYTSVDNFGSKTTGETRFTIGGVGNNLLGMADQWVLEITGSSEQGNTAGKFGVGFPVGYSGGRVGLNYSRSEYLLGDIFKALEYRGESNTLSLWGSYPFIRSARNNWSVRASYDNSKPTSSVLGKEVSRVTGEGGTLAISGRTVDEFFTDLPALMSYGLGYSAGTSKSELGSSAGTTSSSSNVQWSIQRGQNVLSMGGAGSIAMNLNLRGQQALGDQPIGAYSLGGPGAVRAYPVGEASGDNGMIFTAEVRYSLYFQPTFPAILTVGLFHDRGQIENITTTTAADRQKRVLEGSGILVEMNFFDRSSIRVEYAKRGDSSPKSKLDDTETDARVWLVGNINF